MPLFGKCDAAVRCQDDDGGKSPFSADWCTKGDVRADSYERDGDGRAVADVQHDVEGDPDDVEAVVVVDVCKGSGTRFLTSKILRR